MSDQQPPVPSLPQYNSPSGLRVADRKEAAPMMKLMGKMLAAKLPRMGKNKNIHSQSVKIKHQKKVRYW